jgi:two-component system, NtrC family, sensor histidine kinase PilS
VLSPRSEAARSLWLITLFRLFVALFLVWLGELAPGEPVHSLAAKPTYQYATFGYLVYAVLLMLIARGGAHVSAVHLRYQAGIGATGDILAIALVLAAVGGVESGLGLLLIPLLATGTTIVQGRIGLFLAAIATLALLSTEMLIGPQLPWRFEPQPTQTGLLGATLFAAVLLTWRLTQRAGVSEARLARQEEDLAKLAELNAQIIARMDTGVLAVDGSGGIQSMNEAARELLHPGTGDRLEEVSPSLEAAFQDWQRKPVAGATLKVAESPEQHALEVRVAPLGPAGAMGWLLILEDAADILRRGQASKLQALGRLTASIAHEVRNPLGAISHSAQLLAESPALDRGDRRLLEIIQNQGQRVNALIRNVLILARGQAASRDRLLLRERLELFAADFCPAQGIPLEQLQIEVRPARAEVLFDANQLVQVIWNLCDNALRHGGDRTAPVRLRATSDRRGGPVSLDVIDTGPGIPAEKRETLFEPFASGAPEGTGLGLYISRLLCENNDATLDYVPQAGGGFFRILLDTPDTGPTPATPPG